MPRKPSSIRPQKRGRKVYEEAMPEKEEPELEFEPTVIHHLNGIHAALNAMAQQMKDRNDLLAQSIEQKPEETPAGGAVGHGDLDAVNDEITGLVRRFTVVEEFSRTFAAKLDALEKLATSGVGVVGAGNGETPKKRGRPSNAEKAAREAAATGIPTESPAPAPATSNAPTTPIPPPATPMPTVEQIHEVVEQVKEKLGALAVTQKTEIPPATNNEVQIKGYLIAHPGAKATDLVRDLKLSLNRATAYVMLWGSPAGAEQTIVEAAKQTVTVPAKVVETVPAAPPSVDDVRAVAITWIGNHGKEKFIDVLKKYGATSLSSVAEEQRAGLMAELAEGK